MQIGDKMLFTPAAFGAEKSGALPGHKEIPRQVTGQVVYIHPKRWYFTVAAVVNGQTIKESFKFKSISQ